VLDQLSKASHEHLLSSDAMVLHGPIRRGICKHRFSPAFSDFDAKAFQLAVPDQVVDFARMRAIYGGPGYSDRQWLRDPTVVTFLKK